MRLGLIGFLVTATLGFAQSRPEFEVASIKSSPPPGSGPITTGCIGGPGSNDPGLFNCYFMSLTNLVAIAYQAREAQLSRPDWMDSARFELRAKVPVGSKRDQIGAMMQNLLADRFKLIVHHESRDDQKYDLVVAKSGSKLKQAPDTPVAAPSVGTPGPPKVDSEGFPILRPGQTGMTGMRNHMRMYQPQYTTAMLAAVLSGQVRKPVTDATGLTGKYEIALYWVNDGPSASDIDAGPTLMQALQDQLGLRLESKRGPVDFVIIDHIEKLPTEN
jgi:uncharacterized protein (TIGR03435 family)